MKFRQLFFRLYDSAISGGVCSFSQTGIKKNDFIRLCTDDSFVLDRDSIIRASEAMRLSDEQCEELLALAAEVE